MTSEKFISDIVDQAAARGFIIDYSIDLHENTVVEARLQLEKGFVDIYRNFETGKVAFAWIVEEERVFGADNTGGWHIHPFEDPESHFVSEEFSLEDFLDRVELEG